MDMEFLKKKAGPLTYGEWSLVGAGGIAIAYWYRKKTAAASATANAGNAYDPLNNGSVPTAGSGLGSLLSSLGTTGSQYSSNSEWGNAAVNALTGAGVAPGTAEQAISDYLAGNVLTAAEQSLVSQAIGLIGSPPGGPLGLVNANTNATGTTTTGSTGTVNNNPAGGTTTTDTGTGTTYTGTTGSTGTTTTPAIGGTYTVQKGDNWITVAQRAGVTEAALLAANAARGPGALAIGETLYLPVGAGNPAVGYVAPSTPTNVTTPAKTSYYVVKSGDNWITVAAKYGISESALLALNAARGPSALRIGETLVV